MKDHLRIGELARLFHLDVQTLRLYEDKGLLLPEGREPESNYRFYRADQVYPLALIRYLRRLECPLAEIGNFMSERSFTETCSYLRHQSETLRAPRQHHRRDEPLAHAEREQRRQALPLGALDRKSVV